MEIREYTDNERKEVLNKAIAKYGENQLNIAQEELSELIQAISKIKRYPNSKDAQLNLIEEIADVSIMIEQLQMYFGITDEVVQDEVDIKLDRLENKMFEEDAIIFYRDYLDKQKTKQFKFSTEITDDVNAGLKKITDELNKKSNEIASKTTKSTECIINEIIDKTIIGEKWTVSKAEKCLKNITGQNVKCELKQFTLIINLEYIPEDEIQVKIEEYIHNYIPCGMLAEINIRSIK